MNSPESSSRKNSQGETHLLKVECTPKNQKLTTSTDEYCLYGLHSECSPNFGCGHDGLEIGWGDSPEPLNIEQRYSLTKTPVTCKKKLETKESPRSSIPFKRRNVRSSFNLPSKPVIDVAKYVAEVQELSKNIMKEFSAQKTDSELSEDEKLVACTQFVEDNVKSKRLSSPIFLDRESSFESEVSLNVVSSGSSNVQNKDSAFDSVLQSFINEEDDWLSQALCTQEVPKTPCKIGFVKSRSENELTIPTSININTNNSEKNCRNINNNFRRTSSFDFTKSQNNSVCPSNNGMKNIKRNFVDENKCVQYSLQEIEKKRLEAKYRRERREIERKKLEAMKRLEMKKMRVIKT